MKINILGGGPAGLYFAILMKKADPAHAIDVYERDGPHDTFGWGIVFSEKTLTFLQEHDAATFDEITRASQTWDDVVVGHPQQTIRVGGNPISGISRLSFLNILHQRCRELGVDLHFHANITPERLAELEACDLLVGADGANSLVRRTYEGFFHPSVDVRQNKYVWLGTAQPFDGLTLLFRETDAGLFIAHAYKFTAAPQQAEGAISTFIVECPPGTWAQAGFEHMSEPETCAYLARVFEKDLHGHALHSNNFLRWLNFPLIKNKHWYHKHIVLLGDALHTAHFSIGSGTKLALEDAIALTQAFGRCPEVPGALEAFERARQPVVERFQAAAYRSLTWLEQVHKYLPLEPVPFAYRLMTRSRRVGFKRIRRADAAFAAQYAAWRERQPPAGAIPADYLDLFKKKSFGHLATLMPDGSPHVTSVWVDYDGEHLLINSARGRLKDRNMHERPAVAIEIPDPEEPNRYLLVRGRVVEITEEGADAHLDRLAQRYLDREVYPPSMRFAGEVRQLYKILPEHVTTWDPFG